MNVFEFITIIMLMFVSVTAAFFVGFGVGISDKFENKQKPVKKFRSHGTVETSEKIKELNRILSDMERYDGKTVGGNV